MQSIQANEIHTSDTSINLIAGTTTSYNIYLIKNDDKKITYTIDTIILPNNIGINITYSTVFPVTTTLRNYSITITIDTSMLLTPGEYTLQNIIYYKTSNTKQTHSMQYPENEQNLPDETEPEETIPTIPDENPDETPDDIISDVTINIPPNNVDITWIILTLIIILLLLFILFIIFRRKKNSES